MGLTFTDTGGGDYTPTPAGTHIAICDMVVDLGRQRTTFQGEESIKNQVYIRWQIPAERVEWADGDGKKHEGPMVIGKTYTQSLGEKANLRKDLQAWRGKPFTPDELKGFEAKNLLGKPATITVTHVEKNGKTYANVASVGGMLKGMAAPSAEGDLLIYDADNESTASLLPKWLRDKLEARVPVQPSKGEDPNAWRANPTGDGGSYDDLDDDLDSVPF